MTITAKDFHATVVAETKAKGALWSTLGQYYNGKGWDAEGIICDQKANGQLDNSKYVAEFKGELGEGEEYKATIRSFQKYVSTLNNAKSIIQEFGDCAVGSEGNEEVISLAKLFNYDNKGNIAPKPVFDEIIRSMKEQETPLQALARASAIIEKNMSLIAQADMPEINVMIGKISQAHYLLTQSFLKVS